MFAHLVWYYFAMNANTQERRQYQTNTIFILHNLNVAKDISDF